LLATRETARSGSQIKPAQGAEFETGALGQDAGRPQWGGPLAFLVHRLDETATAEDAWFYVNVVEKYCSCYDCEQHGICCHLMFASKYSGLPDHLVTGPSPSRHSSLMLLHISAFTVFVF
jgi:hypothetical protein